MDPRIVGAFALGVSATLVAATIAFVEQEDRMSDLRAKYKSLVRRHKLAIAIAGRALSVMDASQVKAMNDEFAYDVMFEAILKKNNLY